MSSIPSGSVSVTFAADRTQIDAFLAELRKGYTVPVRPEMYRGPGGPGTSGGAGGGGQTGEDRAATARERRVDMAWDRAALAQQRAAEAAERRAQQQTQREQAAAQREQRREAATRAREAEQDEKPSGRILGLKPGRLLQYATAGFILREGLAVVQDIQESRLAARMAATPLQSVEAQMQMAGVLGKIPVVGQAASVLTRPWYDQAKLAIFGAEESLKDEQFGLRIGEQQRTRLVQERSAQLAGYRAGIVGSFPRREWEIRDAQTLREQEFQNKGQQMREAINAEQDAYQKNRLAREYNRYVTEEPSVLAAQKKLDDANLRALKREHDLIVKEQRGLEPGLQAAAEGRFGEAGERFFSAGLAQTEREAYEKSPILGVLTHGLNLLRQAGHNAEIQANIAQRTSQGDALAFELVRDPLGAARERIAGAMNAALSQAPPAEFASIRRNAALETRLVEQREDDRLTSMRFQLRASAETLGIAINGPGQPATREVESEINRLKRETQQQELGAFQSGRPSLVPDIARLGVLQLQGFQQDFLRAGRAEEVSINRTSLSGVGTEDPAAILSDIRDAIKDLKNVPQSLDALKNALGNLVAQ